jgi:hypothetical protein
MRWRFLASLTLFAFFALALATRTHAAEAVCAESISLELDDGTITGHLIGEESVSDPFLFPVLFPIPWLAPVRTSVGIYQLSDGRRIWTGCFALAN